MAEGIHPQTGEPLAADHICNRQDTVQALHTLLEEVDASLLPHFPGKPWDAAEDQALLEMFDRGCTRQEMRTRFQRADEGIAARLVYLGRISSRAEYRKRLPQP